MWASQHVLNSCVHHGADTLDVDIENIIFKIYQYFHINTAHRESEGVLWMCWCWIQTSPFSQQNAMAVIIPRYWEAATDVSSLESILFVTGKNTLLDQEVFFKMNSVKFISGTCTDLCVFHSHIHEMERESNSIVEVKNILYNVHTMLLERKTNNFMSLKVKGLVIGTKGWTW